MYAEQKGKYRLKVKLEVKDNEYIKEAADTVQYS